MQGNLSLKSAHWKKLSTLMLMYDKYKCKTKLTKMFWKPLCVYQYDKSFDRLSLKAQVCTEITKSTGMYRRILWRLNSIFQIVVVSTWLTPFSPPPITPRIIIHAFFRRFQHVHVLSFEEWYNLYCVMKLKYPPPLNISENLHPPVYYIIYSRDAKF